MATLRQRLEKLKDQREVLDARIRKEAAKVGAEGRKRRNRQKYIVGGIVLAAVNENNALAAQLLALIKAKAGEYDMQVLADALPPPPAAALDYLPEDFFDGSNDGEEQEGA